MAAYVYVMRSSVTGQHYIGSTTDLKHRIERYNDPGVQLSRASGPWECVYVEICDSLDAARTRERFLKSMEGVEEKIQILYTYRATKDRGRE